MSNRSSENYKTFFLNFTESLKEFFEYRTEFLLPLLAIFSSYILLFENINADWLFPASEYIIFGQYIEQFFRNWELRALSGCFFGNPFLNIYPPIPQLFYGLFFYFFGYSDLNVLLMNFFWVALLTIFLTLLSKELFKGRFLFSPGLIFISFPVTVLMQYCFFQSELPVTSLFIVSFYLVVKTRVFRSRFFSVLSGIFIGFMALAKWTFIIYMFPIIILYVLKILQFNFKSAAKKQVSNILLALFFALLVSIPWYYKTSGDFFGYFFSTTAGPLFVQDVSSRLEAGLFQNLLFYVSNISVRSGWLFTVAILLSVFFVIWRHLKRRRNSFSEVLLIFSVFSVYLSFSLIKRKLIPHIFPLIPLISLLISYSLYLLKSEVVKRKIYLISAGICFYLLFFPAANTVLHKFFFSNFFYLSGGKAKFDKIGDFKFSNDFTEKFGQTNIEAKNIIMDLLVYLENRKNAKQPVNLFLSFNSTQDVPLFLNMQQYIFQRLFTNKKYDVAFFENFETLPDDLQGAFIISRKPDNEKGLKIIKTFTIMNISYSLCSYEFY